MSSRWATAPAGNAFGREEQESMAEHPEKAQFSCQLEAVPVRDAVDVATPITFEYRVTCPEAFERQGATLELRDQEGQLLQVVELEHLLGGVTAAGEITAPAPSTPGDYSWSLTLPRQEAEEAVFQESRAQLGFSARPHAVRLETWGLPTAVTAGEEFRVKVGVKCSAGCDLTGWRFEIVDQDEKRLAGGEAGPEPWQGTKSLYHAEVTLPAPSEPGIFRWRVRTAAADEVPAHDAAERSFGANAVSPPEHVLTVEAFDRDKGEPIAGMHVLLHPFRALTDENGVARLAVPKGNYSLLVSGFRYYPYRTQLEIAEDTTVRAEVEWEPIVEKISG